MIKKLRIKIIATSVVAVFVLLAVVVSIINIMNFAMVANDADNLLIKIEKGNGQFSQPGQRVPEQDKGMMGPDSPDIEASIRFFTFAFNDKGEIKTVFFNMSAITEVESMQWASELKDANSSKGWTHSTYRYEVYAVGKDTYVTVIDQGREFLPSYRVLWTSIICSFAGIVVTFVVLVFLSKQFVRPIEESDKKQKNFVLEASAELKNPLSVIALENSRLSENEVNTESTQAIGNQLDKLFSLTKNLDRLSSIKKSEYKESAIDLSGLVAKEVENVKEQFEKKNIELTLSIKENVSFFGDENMFHEMLYELLSNAINYSKTESAISLNTSGSRISLIFENDADNLPNGDLDRIFEKFYKNPNVSKGKGLGLSLVKEVINLHSGKIMAQGKDGRFVLKIEL